MAATTLYTVSVKIMIREHHPADSIPIQKEFTGAFENSGRKLNDCVLERLEELKDWVERNVPQDDEEGGSRVLTGVWPGTKGD